jgi:transcriptional regulator with XRE-family HTH domain
MIGKCSRMSLIYAISPMQSKVARTYLNWSQDDLAAAAEVSRSTVRSFESGFSPRRGSVAQMRKAFEKADIEFMEGDGVKRRTNKMIVYRGYDGRDQFYNDVLETTKDQGGDILCAVKSQDLFLRACGVTDGGGFERLESLGKLVKIKCLITGAQTLPVHVPSVEFRTTPHCHIINTSSSFGYGNKYVTALEEGRTDILFTIYHIAQAAQDYRFDFLSVWENALPLHLSLSVSPQLHSGLPDRRTGILVGA